MDEQYTFESLRFEVQALEPPTSKGERRTYWASPRKLGLARTSDGALEIFIVGSELRPYTSAVRRHLEHGRWSVAGTSDLIEANKIVLPSAPHFEAIATLIATELIRAGIAGQRPQQAVFDEVEPIIELSLRQGALGDEHVLGLIGELLCLEAMLDAVRDRPELRMSVLDMWQGHRRGQRDFTIGTTGIEVKTTQSESSSHKISGLHQVELDERAGTERRLYLLSIGLATSEHGGQALPEIVERVMERLEGSEGGLSTLQHRFTSDVASYGPVGAKGYHHQTMSTWAPYQVKYRTTFTPRLYDLLDHDVRIVRRVDLIGTFVRADDIQYGLDLSQAINGTNPVPNWQHSVTRLVRDEFESLP